MTEYPSPLSHWPPKRAPGRRRRRIRQWIIVALLALGAFEVGVRLLPADAVQVTETPYGLTGVGPTTTQTFTDPGVVAAMRAAISERLTGYPAWTPYGVFGPECEGGAWENVTYRFTWLGLPVEVAHSDAIGCGSLQFLACSSGGFTAPFLYEYQPMSSFIAPAASAAAARDR